MAPVLSATLLAILGRSSDAAGFPDMATLPQTFLSKANAAEQADAKNPVHARDTFVHLFEWSWADIATECEEWLAPKGYTAVQVSPPSDHKVGPEWWVRYQPVTYNLTSRSGDEAAFIDMIDRCNAVGVGIYADAVINHIAADEGISIAGNPWGNRSSPIYTSEDFHNDGDVQSNCVISDYNNRSQVQNCDLLGLPDLCTECASVQQTVANYLNYMGSLGLAGYRVDGAKHMAAVDLNHMLSLVDPSLYVFHEVIGNDAEPVKPNEYFFPTSGSDVTEFSYFWRLHSNIGGPDSEGKLQYMETLGESWNIMPQDKAVVFIDNHDTQRSGYHNGMNYKDGDMYALYNIFMLAHPYGFPKVMSSYYFPQVDFNQGPPANSVHVGDGTVRCMDDANWVCEHRWPSIANMVAWRRAAGANNNNAIENFTKLDGEAGTAIAFCRGGAACVALNQHQTASWSGDVIFGVPAGIYCNVIVSDDLAACPKIEVAADGSASIEVPPKGAVAIHSGKFEAPVDEDGGHTSWLGLLVMLLTFGTWLY